MQYQYIAAKVPARRGPPQWGRSDFLALHACFLFSYFSLGTIVSSFSKEMLVYAVRHMANLSPCGWVYPQEKRVVSRSWNCLSSLFSITWKAPLKNLPVLRQCELLHHLLSGKQYGGPHQCLCFPPSSCCGQGLQPPTGYTQSSSVVFQCCPSQVPEKSKPVGSKTLCISFLRLP